MKKQFSIYIHIPFCEKKCNYCNFPSSSKKEHLFEKYFSALKKEITATVSLTEDCFVTTIYFGGGTPSCVPPHYLADTLSTIKDNYTVKSDAEITVECNPHSITSKFAELMIMSGVNRFSVGIQSLNDAELKILGRLHNSNMAISSCKILRNSGAKNISVDFMFGIPNQTKKTLETTLKTVADELAPEHLSLYSLTVEPGTLFAKRRAKLNFPSDDAVADWFVFAEKLLKKHSYKKYEISNFAKTGFESQHNKTYWDTEKNYIGFGAAAHSFCKLKSKEFKLRFRNIKSIEKYIKRVENGQNFRYFSSPLNHKEQIGEKIYLGLRLVEGVQLSGGEFALFKEEIEEQVSLGLIKKSKNHKIALTKRGLQIANTVMQNFV